MARRCQAAARNGACASSQSAATWVSERSGWTHVYLVSRDGRTVRPLTSGAFDVLSVVGLDEDGRYLYYIASPENPTQRYLYRVRTAPRSRP